MRNYIIFVFLGFISSTSFALELTPVLGLRGNSPESHQTGYKDVSGLGLKLGALTRIEISPTLFVRTGLIYNQRDYSGEVYVDVLINRNIDFTQKVSYLDVPLNLQWITPIPEMYIFGGLIYAAKVSDSISYDPSLASLNLQEDPQRALASSDTLLNLGVGYTFLQLANAKLSVEAEYEYGLNDIEVTPSSSATVNQRSFVINLLYTMEF